MPPIRTRTFLLVLISIGVFYYYSDRYLLSSNSQDFVSVPDTLHHGGDAGSISTDLVTAFTSEVLLVSAFFPLNRSHHSGEEYEEWLGNFLETIQTPIYFFTPPEIAPLVRKQRGSLPITINSSYTDPFDVPPVQGLYDYYYKMHRWQNKDRKAEGPGLYALRTAKPWFLAEAVKNYERLASGSKPIGYAFWVDIGSFQDGLVVRDWPNVERVKEMLKEGAEATGKSEDELIFFPINDVPNLTMQWWKEDMGPFYRNFAQVSFFGGTPNVIEWWKEVYLKYHDYWLFKREAFVGQDRTMFNSLSLLFPGRIITVWASDPYEPGSLEGKVNPLGICGDIRWYFRYFLSSRSERRTIGILLKSRVWRMPWQIFSPVEECRLTGVLGMEDVLRRNFGSSWNPPRAELDLSVDYRPKH
ncbi:hypothetical protein BDM02DRAFT_3186247 [Thelephora ganbajun]|uniref:Uncharacterized protein n=1 Tax=Thelephora ganbajun TaxID=370292 RepID=A0ACB6ZIR7_THEGA|nr:hypothetical protein BDM02DRAFT_3186247 [Thelephora ganbajun]